MSPSPIRRTTHAVWAWWTTDRWRDAADLALKLLGIVAAIAALNFFSSRPRVVLAVSCKVEIDRARLTDLYHPVPIPAKLLQIDLTNSLRPTLLHGGGTHIWGGGLAPNALPSRGCTPFP